MDNTLPRVPFMQLPVVAFLLAISAGMLNGYSFSTSHSFATFQSGNVIMLGYNISIGKMESVLPYILMIVFFGAGSMLLALIRSIYNSEDKIWSFRIITIEVVLIIALVLYLGLVQEHHSHFHVAWALAFIAGMQGNAFHKISGMLYGNIAVTLNVQLAFSAIVEALVGKGKDRRDACYKVICYFSTLIGFAAGAFCMAVAVQHYKIYALLLTLVPLLLIFFAAYRDHEDDRTALIDSN
jgi:uncharacterized membrane protein YoaK (UPF0700 family)